MKRTGSDAKTSKSRNSSTRRGRSTLPRLNSPDLRFVVCIKNDGYIDLVPGQVYKVAKQQEARSECLLRVVDGSGESYLYPFRFFAPIHAPRRLFQMMET
jgi:hypothetical protein